MQGEGIYQGITQVFVRFFGCNLKCRFCDTKLNYYQEKNLEDLLSEINTYNNYHSISLTGGEPLLQIDFLEEFTKRLKKEGKIVYLETNGTLYENLKRVINNVDLIAMDFKLPSSTTLRDFWLEHREFLKIARNKELFIKAVIGKATQIEDVRIGLAIVKELKANIPFILQPESPFEDELEEKLQYFKKVCKRENLREVKIIPQLHKKLGIK